LMLLDIIFCDLHPGGFGVVARTGPRSWGKLCFNNTKKSDDRQMTLDKIDALVV